MPGLKVKRNPIHFDGAAAADNVAHKLYDGVVRRYEEVFCRCFSEYLQTTTEGNNGPGKPLWRKEIANLVREQSHFISSSIIEANVGLPDDLEATNRFMFIRAMLVIHGSGSKRDGGGPAMYAGPKGRKVFNTDLDGITESKVENRHLLPESWNMQGNHATDRAIEEFNKNEIEKMLKACQRAVTAGCFSKYITGKRGH